MHRLNTIQRKLVPNFKLIPQSFPDIETLFLFSEKARRSDC